MSLLRYPLLGVLLAVILTAVGHYYIQLGRSQEAARLRSENDQLRLKASQHYQAQLAKNSGSGLEFKSHSLGTILPSGGSMVADPGAPTTEVPAALGTEYRNEGQATPAATLQTLAWACDHADAALMEKLLIYDEDARQKTLRHFATQTAGNPAELPSIEAAAAALYIEDGMHHPYPVAKILELAKFEELRPGRVLLHLPGANGDGYEFRQTPDGWKLAVTMKVVDDYIKESAERVAKP